MATAQVTLEMQVTLMDMFILGALSDLILNANTPKTRGPVRPLGASLQPHAVYFVSLGRLYSTDNNTVDWPAVKRRQDPGSLIGCNLSIQIGTLCRLRCL